MSALLTLDYRFFAMCADELISVGSRAPESSRTEMGWPGIHNRSVWQKSWPRVCEGAIA